MTKPNTVSKLPESPAQAFLNTAQQYHLAATLLSSSGKNAKMPVYFLYAHTIELALKAFIRSFGCPITRIHDLKRLTQDCEKLGLRVSIDLANVISLLESENRFQGFRYFTFKSTGVPEIDFLRGVVDDLMIVVKRELERKPGEDVIKGVVMKFTVGKPVEKGSDKMRK
jgi:HEPN domain-containing protein